MGLSPGGALFADFARITEIPGTCSAQRGQVVGDAEEEDEPDAATVDGAGPCDGVVEAGMVAAGLERSAHGGRHQGVHRYQAERKSCQAHHSTGSSTEIGGEEEERQLAGRLGSYAVQHADQEDRFSVVHPLEALWLRRVWIPQATDLPGQPQNAIDGDSQTALDAAVPVPVGIFTQDSRHYPCLLYTSRCV